MVRAMVSSSDSYSSSSIVESLSCGLWMYLVLGRDNEYAVSVSCLS